MALRLAIEGGARGNLRSMLGLRRWVSSTPQPPPLGGAMNHEAASEQLVLPGLDSESSRNNIGFDFPISSFGGSMDTMAVPKRKVTPHKRGIRNGPKALKPVPVIIRCKSCGRVKLPHFFCCSGNRGNIGEP